MFKHIKILVTATIIFLSAFNAASQLTPRVQATSSNAIQNPGFESSNAWTPVYFGGYAKVQDSAYAHTGSYSGLTTTKSPRYEFCVASLYQNLSNPVRNLWNFSFWIRKGPSAANGYDAADVCIVLSNGYVLSYYFNFAHPLNVPGSTSTKKYIRIPAVDSMLPPNTWNHISRILYNDLIWVFRDDVESILTQNVSRIEFNSYGYRDPWTRERKGQRVNWDDIYMEQFEVRAWTFMVYMDADNDLVLNGNIDIGRMEEIGSTSDVAIIVQFEFRDYSLGYGEAERYCIEKDKRRIIEDLDHDVNMGDPNELSDFIEWTINLYPAQRYALILWDHGNGFRGVCVDWTSEDLLTMVELKSALIDAELSTGVVIDLVGFQACLMGQMEVAFQIHGLTEVFVGSEESMKNTGWPYNWILGNLTASSVMTAQQLETQIVTSFSHFYGGAGYEDQPLNTMSAIDMAKIWMTAQSMSDLGEWLIDNLDTYRSNINSSRQNAYEYGRSALTDLVDAYNLTYFLNQSILDAEVESGSRRCNRAVVWGELEGSNNRR